MPQSNGFKPFIIDTLISYFKDAFGDYFKEYYFGDPIDIPLSQTPCLIISKTSGTIGLGATGMDELDHEILIQVVLDKMGELGNPDPEATVHRKVVELVEGRDETTGEFKQNSVIGVLRRNITLGNLVTNQDATINYGVMPRPEDSLTEEGHISLTIHQLQTVSNRV